MTGTKRVRKAQASERGPEREWRERIKSAQSIALFLDFDGTLVANCGTPGLAKIDPDIRDVLIRLSNRDDVTITVVSGRALADVRERAGIRGIIYAGNHGLEIESDTSLFSRAAGGNSAPGIASFDYAARACPERHGGRRDRAERSQRQRSLPPVNEELQDWVRRTVAEVVEQSRSFTCRDRQNGD